MLKKKTLVLLLSLLFLASLLFLNVSAEESRTTVLWKRFSNQSLVSPNTALSTDENGHLTMSFKSVSPTLSAKVSPDAYGTDKNAIRISMINSSACSQLVLTYQYSSDEGELKTASERLSLGTRNVRHDYFVYTDKLDRITEISLTFSGVATGYIKIMSIDFLSVFQDDEETCGAVTACVYDSDKDIIQISGNVKYEIVTAHRTAKLVLYALDINDSSLSYGWEPAADVSMSSHFDFVLSKVSIKERMKAYVVAVVEQEEILYSFAPVVPTSERDAAEEKIFFKGIHSDAGILAARANAKLAVVDVDFAKLVSKNMGEGLLYPFGGKYYYFNRQYISFLDSEIQQNYENGMSIALRFMSSKSPKLGFSPIIADSEETLLQLYAYTEFLCDRYSNSSRGELSGIVFGTPADAVFSPSGAMLNYTHLYAESLFVISEAAASSGSNICLIVPVSDHFEQGAADNISFSPRVFLTSLGKILEKRYLGNLLVSVMVESDAMSGEGHSYGQLGFENIADISLFLEQIHSAYPAISDQYWYWWEPTDTDEADFLNASLIHGYYAAACEEQAGAFILSTAYLSDISSMEELMSCLQYADNSLGKMAADAALLTLGKENWHRLIDGFSEDKIFTVTYRETSGEAMDPSRFLGETYLWDFSGMGNDSGWSAGAGCEAVVMQKNEETNRALSASMLPNHNHRYESELIYCFDETRRFEAVDAVSFVMSVDAPKGKYLVTVQLSGDTELSEVTALLSAGEISTIYVDTAGLFTEEAVRCIRIFTAPEGDSQEAYTLLIGSISAHSSTKDAQALEDSLKPAQTEDAYLESKQGISPVWIYTIVFVTLVSVMVVAILSFRNEEES